MTWESPEIPTVPPGTLPRAGGTEWDTEIQREGDDAGVTEDISTNQKLQRVYMQK